MRQHRRGGSIGWLERHARKLGASPGGSNGVATGGRAGEIPHVSHPLAPAQPPYALATFGFRHRNLASLAARAPIGPARDVALAWFVCARLLDGLTAAPSISPPARAARGAAARLWLAGAGLPSGSRLPLARVIDACSAEGEVDRARLAKAVSDALKATAEHLDPATRGDLEAYTKG